MRVWRSRKRPQLQGMAPTSLVGMTAGFLVWSAYFVVMYAVLSLACVNGAAPALIVAALAVLAAATAAVIGWLGWRAWSTAAAADAERSRFMSLTAALAAGLALVSTLWVAAPVLMLAPCA